MDEHVVISRAEAKAAGLKRYFTGKPCPHGHVEERKVSTWGCMKCLNGQAKIRHKEAYRSNPAPAKERVAKWCRDNPDAKRAMLQARRARELGAIGQYTRRDIAAILIRQCNKCVGCEASFRVTPSTVDHVVPLSRGGVNWPYNLQLLCSPCNTSKGAKLMSEWRVAA